MKVVALREAKQRLSGCVVRAQRERVLITKQGRPAALMIGVEGHDLEDVLLMQNPRFWKMIEARRGEPTFGLDEVRRQLGVPPPSSLSRAKGDQRKADASAAKAGAASAGTSIGTKRREGKR